DISGVKPDATVNTLGVNICPERDSANQSLCPQSEFQDRHLTAGDPLVALGDGVGMRRGSPEIRRFMGLAQTALDAADPASFAPNFEKRLLTYGTGEEVRTRALIFSTIGDMNVPMATGAA